MSTSDNDEIGFYGDEKTPEPIIVRRPPREEHAALLKWAQSRGLTIDPRMGRAESGELRQARAAASRLEEICARYEAELERGTPSESQDWQLDDARAQADMLRSLKGKV